MIISHSKKFIFIHIYKTAGTSISQLLLPHARFIEKISAYYFTSIFIKIINNLFGLNDMGNKWINGIHKHAKAIECKKYLDEKVFKEYFKFAFVRHPMDWQVSLYEYIKNTSHKDHDIVKNISFKEFVYREISNNSPRQVDFLMDDNKFIINKFFKLESIDQDIKKLFEILNIKSKDKNISHLNKSLRMKNFYDYYDDELEKKVRAYYSKDFKLLGYE